MNTTEEFISRHFDPETRELFPPKGIDHDKIQAMHDLWWEWEREERRAAEKSAGLRFIG